ncbi:Wzz/FepE/Etk N-terminal domain-containing protein [Candidatus Oleimmundimicrobium sp.]|uniref:YveK family protein n=1 Tax=Candidatus Oleimmundimicrobium sp. TaxID=3060597 RepID=UPI00271ED0C2|nr:Wzz/FepE/Etk N-terminal domain-containing protein [Candidatus Oleimmundimicrobium sp.]MDO8885564.1 Wzz/FepE/Etk N-terminal domain-containing protein [Candidatus Oleimmundimicrobium sp.]
MSSQNFSGFNPRVYTSILWRRKWIIAVVVTFVFAGVLCSRFSTPPLYESRSIIEIGHVYDSLDRDNKRVIDWLTTREIVTSDAFVSEAIKKLGWDTDSASLKKMIEVENQEQNIITTIIAKSASPEDAQKLSNALAGQFVEKYNEVYKSQIEPVEQDVQNIKETLDGENVLITKTEQTIEDLSEGKSVDKEAQELKLSLLNNATAALYMSRKDLLLEAADLKSILAKSSGFKVIYPATLPTAPNRQSLLVLLVTALFVSFVLGSILAFAVDYWLSFPAAGDKKGK